jgi:DNA-binding response OmpR family regulator
LFLFTDYKTEVKRVERVRKLKKRILVADDNPAILDALKIMLEEEGYEVETTVDGATVLDMKKPLPDLLLLDIWMSGVDGRDVCKLLKSTTATKHIPIIMVSAAKDTEQIAKDSGADDFIAKPFQMDHLLATVAKYVNRQ